MGFNIVHGKRPKLVVNYEFPNMKSAINKINVLKKNDVSLPMYIIRKNRRRL